MAVKTVNAIISCGYNSFFRHCRHSHHFRREIKMDWNLMRKEAVYFYETPTKVAELFLIMQKTLSEIILCCKTFRHLRVEAQ